MRTFKLSNYPHFEDKFWVVIGLDFELPIKALVLCCDAMIHYQALERTSALPAAQASAMREVAPSTLPATAPINPDRRAVLS